MVVNRNDSKRQKELRKSIAERVQSSPSHTVDRIARDFGVSPSVVYRACAEQGVSLVRASKDIVEDPLEILGRLLKADTEVTVTDLARDMGVPRKSVDDIIERARQHEIPVGRWAN